MCDLQKVCDSSPEACKGPRKDEQGEHHVQAGEGVPASSLPPAHALTALLWPWEVPHCH